MRDDATRFVVRVIFIFLLPEFHINDVVFLHFIAKHRSLAVQHHEPFFYQRIRLSPRAVFLGREVFIDAHREFFFLHRGILAYCFEYSVRGSISCIEIYLV